MRFDFLGSVITFILPASLSAALEEADVLHFVLKNAQAIPFAVSNVRAEKGEMTELSVRLDLPFHGKMDLTPEVVYYVVAKSELVHSSKILPRFKRRGTWQQ